MIAKIGRGANLPKFVRYLFGPGRANEHSDQHLIAAATSLESFPMGVELSAKQVRDLSAQMELVRIQHGIPAKGALRRLKVAGGPTGGPDQLPGIEENYEHGPGHVWHMSFTLAKEDGRLSDEQWAAIAKGAMDRLGFTEASGKSPVRWIAVRHGLTGKGLDHVHIATTIVRDDGTKATDWQSERMMSAFAAEVEREYSLVVVKGRQTRGRPGLTRAEVETALRDRQPEAARTALARLVREARTTSVHEAEFVDHLRAAGVRVRPRWAAATEEGTEAVTGYSVALPPRGKGTTVWFGGGRLGADLSLPELRRFWESTPTETTAALSVWRSPGQRGKAARATSSEEWQRAAKVLDAGYGALQGLPPDSPAWPVVARELSGLYGAWSRHIEGGRPGPLARAADLLAEAGQVPRDAELPSLVRLHGYRGAAIAMAQGHLGKNNRGTGWAMLVSALNRHLSMVARIEGLRGQLRLAERLAMTAGEIESVSTPMLGAKERRDVPRPPQRLPGRVSPTSEWELR